LELETTLHKTACKPAGPDHHTDNLGEQLEVAMETWLPHTDVWCNWLRCQGLWL